MSPTFVLVSGANRGLGFGLAQRYLAKPEHVVVAANRDPTTSKSLNDLPKGPGSRLIIVKVDASAEADALEAVKTLTSEHNIDHLDIVIANAGVSYIYPKVSDLKISDIKAHIEPNVYGVVRLYQATLPLLLKSVNAKWVTMGSTAGVLEYGHPLFSRYVTDVIRGQLPIPNAAYGPSKAAIHWLTKRMDQEEEKLTAFVLSPGWVQTDMGNAGARNFGQEQAPVTVEDSCTKTVELIEKAAKESHGGQLWSYEGEKMSW